jgi:prevent-host-death family protein
MRMISWQSDLSDKVERVTTMTATEASRSFSDLLNRVAAGEEIEITRAGATVAVIGPPAPKRFISPKELADLLGSFDFDEDFAKDIEAIRREVGPAPQESPWDS